MDFSIIVPTYERPEALRRCLAGLSVLDYPGDEFEVIVVDDGGATNTVAVAEDFRGRLDLRLIRQENGGPGSARNRGAGEASGEMLAFLDDDCVPRPGWLKAMRAAAEQAPGAMLGGWTLNACASNVFAELNQMMLLAVMDWLRSQGSALYFIPSNNMFLPGAAFREMGGFHADFRLAGGEDRELCARWLALGLPIVAVPEAVIDHRHPQTLRTFVRMHLRYGRGAAQLHRSRESSPIKFARSGLYRALIHAVVRSDVSTPRIVLMLLLGLAQGAEAAGYGLEMLRSKDGIG